MCAALRAPYRRVYRDARPSGRARELGRVGRSGRAAAEVVVRGSHHAVVLAAAAYELSAARPPEPLAPSRGGRGSSWRSRLAGAEACVRVGPRPMGNAVRLREVGDGWRGAHA